MAYMSQQKKAEIAPQIREILSRYRVKASLAVRNHSTLVLNIRSGDIDFIGNYQDRRQGWDSQHRQENQTPLRYLQVNPYWYQEHFTGGALDFLTEVFTAMNRGNYDRSDAQSDYFCVGWYVDVNIGQWNRPYLHTA